MLKIKCIIPQVVKIFGPNDELVGHANEYEFRDFCVQIRREGAEGYYALFVNEEGEEIRVNIKYDGSTKNVNGFFDMLAATTLQRMRTDARRPAGKAPATYKAVYPSVGSLMLDSREPLEKEEHDKVSKDNSEDAAW